MPVLKSRLDPASAAELEAVDELLTISRVELNVDLSVAKDFRLAGTSTAQIKFEILNLTNTAKFNGSSADNAIDNDGFGRITSQRGFMRIWQISMRLQF